MEWLYRIAACCREYRNEQFLIICGRLRELYASLPLSYSVYDDGWSRNDTWSRASHVRKVARFKVVYVSRDFTCDNLNVFVLICRKRMYLIYIQ